MRAASRQVFRQIARHAAKAEAGRAKEQARVETRRALLARQTEREKADFYAGRSVAASIAPSRSRIAKRKVAKGTGHCRILRTIVEFGRENQYHATKGWRSYRATGAAA